MTKLDPVIAVRDVAFSTKWYEQIFGFKKTHGTGEIAVLANEDAEIILCLHRWGAPHHPSMRNPDIQPGNGLLLYFRTDKINKIRENAIKAGAGIAAEIHVNPNSTKREFSIYDPDGYLLTMTEYHEYDGNE